MKQIACIISVINLKGGVGKTTITVALAEFLALQHHMKVLVIDLDPQTNATMCLMDEMEWKKRNIRGQTVFSIFRDRIFKRQIFDPAQAIVQSVGNIAGGIPGLDLLPSSLDLMDLQDSVPLIRGNGVFSSRPLTILGEAISEIAAGYDIVLIDCPPNLGLVTQNGLVLSQYYLIPVIPDILSTYGIPQIVDRVHRLTAETGLGLQPLGVVINKYREHSVLHRTQAQLLELNADRFGYQRVFQALIPESSQAASAMDFTVPYSDLMKKYGCNNPFTQYQNLTEEMLNYVR